MAVLHEQKWSVTQEKWTEHPHQQQNVSDHSHLLEIRCIIYPGTQSHFYSDTLIALKYALQVLVKAHIIHLNYRMLAVCWNRVFFLAQNLFFIT